MAMSKMNHNKSRINRMLDDHGKESAYDEIPKRYFRKPPVVPHKPYSTPGIYTGPTPEPNSKPKTKVHATRSSKLNVVKDHKRNAVQVADKYRNAAKEGDAEAQYNYGVCYADGIGVEKNEQQAVAWFRQSAEKGYAEAQYKLAECYLNGQGVDKDLGQAIEWCRKAAEQGHAIAQCQLGCFYMNGIEIEEDDNQAIAWLKKAAEQGLAVAQHILKAYANGDGVQQGFPDVVEKSTEPEPPVKSISPNIKPVTEVKPTHNTEPASPTPTVTHKIESASPKPNRNKNLKPKKSDPDLTKIKATNFIVAAGKKGVANYQQIKAKFFYSD